jgi:hypothetical protein
MAQTITYESGMAELSREMRDYLAYIPKTAEEAIAHVAQGVVLGRGGRGFGKRREGLYGLTRELAFKTRNSVDKLFALKKFNIRRRYSSPGSPLTGAGYGAGASAMGASPQAGPKMYRSADPSKYRAQTRAMLGKDVLVSNQGDKLATTSFIYTKAKQIDYNTTESAKRYKSARFLSIGWLPAVRAWRRSGGQRIKTESLKPNASKHGSVSFEGRGPTFSVIIKNNIPGFAVVEQKYGIIGRALSNVAADTRDYLNKRFSMRRSRHIQGNPVRA